MFEKTFTFWRRLVGKPEEKTPPDHDDRRVWIRYPSDLETTVALADASEKARKPARIRNISRGGASLIVDEAYQTGQLLNLELPKSLDEPNETVQILACVVRSDLEPTGKCSVGCVFSRELTEDDLMGFGARRLRHNPEDQRTWRRYDCNLHANFQKVGDPQSQKYDSVILNVSASGVGLEVDQKVLPGSLLNVEMVGKTGQVHRPLLACVVHVAKKTDERWALGCNFIRELSESEFQEMM